MTRDVVVLVVCVVVLVASLYWKSRHWQVFLDRMGLRQARDLDVTKDPVAAAEWGTRLERDREEKRRELQVKAQHDPKAAKQLRRLLTAEILALEGTVRKIRRDSRVASAISDDVFREWDTKLAELKRLKKDATRLLAGE